VAGILSSFGAFAGFLRIEIFQAGFSVGPAFRGGRAFVSFAVQYIFSICRLTVSASFYGQTFLSELIVSAVFSPLVFFPVRYINHNFSDAE
jgi:hypothetical protein